MLPTSLDLDWAVMVGEFVPRLPRKSGGDQMAPEGRQRDARGTPGHTSDPLAMHVVPRLPRKSGGDQMAPEGRQRDARGTPWRTSDPLATSERVSEWVSGWVSACVREWVSVVRVCVGEWVMLKWVSVVCVCGRVSDAEVSEWVSERVSEWVRECERLWGRRDGKEGADTELKTKTPHVNVGKKDTCIGLTWAYQSLAISGIL